MRCVRDMIISYIEMQRKYKDSRRNSIIRPVWRNSCVIVYELSRCGFKFLCSHLNFRYRACFQYKLLDIRENIECVFTLKCVRDMIIAQSQMHRTDKISQSSFIIWPVWPNSLVFLYKLGFCRLGPFAVT